MYKDISYITRAHGAVGSAFGSQPKGRGFESPWVHQIFLKQNAVDQTAPAFCFIFPMYKRVLKVSIFQIKNTNHKINIIPVIGITNNS